VDDGVAPAHAFVQRGRIEQRPLHLAHRAAARVEPVAVDQRVDRVIPRD
jgi:hypothetical protein